MQDSERAERPCDVHGVGGGESSTRVVSVSPSLSSCLTETPH